MDKRLSILVCTLASRHVLLDRLLYRLKPQLKGKVEIVIETDNGEKTIGKKRNILLHKARGEYISFVDDDDLIPYDYITNILKATKDRPDCCGINGIVTFSCRDPRTFIHSIKNKRWYFRDGVYYRPPNHLNPIKRKLALQVGFPNIKREEDRAFSASILKLLKSEKYIESPMYYYLQGGARVKIRSAKLEGDFSYKAKLSITEIRDSACGIEINDSVFGFQGRHTGKMFTEGPLFKKIDFDVPTSTLIREGRKFSIKVKRRGNELFLSINRERLFSVKCTDREVSITLRPMRSNMEVYSIAIKGKRV